MVASGGHLGRVLELVEATIGPGRGSKDKLKVFLVSQSRSASRSWAGSLPGLACNQHETELFQYDDKR